MRRAPGNRRVEGSFYNNRAVVRADNGDFDGAALAFYRQADVFYGQTPLGGSKR